MVMMTCHEWKWFKGAALLSSLLSTSKDNDLEIDKIYFQEAEAIVF